MLKMDRSFFLVVFFACLVDYLIGCLISSLISCSNEQLREPGRNAPKSDPRTP